VLQRCAKAVREPLLDPPYPMRQTETELKFLVPPAARAAIATELARGLVTHHRKSLMALYLDTADRRLARAGLAWRLRREGRRWIQTLKAGGANALERFEHQVPRPSATADAAEHAGTPAGDQLIALLRQARIDGSEHAVRFSTEVRRTTRRIRTRGAVVEVALDKGRLVAGDASQRILEIEFELVSGSSGAMLRLAERWRKRFALIYEPRSKAERGDGLADGAPFAPLRKAALPVYARRATATQAFELVLDECLSHITRNAIGLIEGDPARRGEHVHQLRVGIRRLRSALRSFQGWVPTPPIELVDSLRTLFATLGMARDSDVLESGVMSELEKAGAPPLKLPPGPAGPDPVDVVQAADTQRMFLAWITWRSTLAELSIDAHPIDGQSDARTFRRNVGRRLRRLHARIVADANTFDALDDAGLHALRKRIKRQRYAVEFFAPLLRRREVERYLGALGAIQDRMGALNDLFVARARYQTLDTPDPAAWFALGWLAARIAEVRALAKPELARLAKADAPKP
jgi:triphosphatase